MIRDPPVFWELPFASLMIQNGYGAAWWRRRIEVSRDFGDVWLHAKTTLAMRVPTMPAPGGWNVLLNSLHPNFFARLDSGGTRTIHLRCAMAAEPTEIQRSSSHGRRIWFRADRDAMTAPDEVI